MSLEDYIKGLDPELLFPGNLPREQLEQVRHDLLLVAVPFGNDV